MSHINLDKVNTLDCMSNEPINLTQKLNIRIQYNTFTAVRTRLPYWVTCTNGGTNLITLLDGT